MKKGKLFYSEIVVMAILIIASVVLFAMGTVAVNKAVTYNFTGKYTFERVYDPEEDHENETICRVEFESEDYTMYVDYSYEEWEELAEDETVEGWVYEINESEYIAFDHEPDEAEILSGAKNLFAEEQNSLFGVAVALLLVAVGLAVITFFAGFFTTYEKIWFISILAAASVVSVIFPEEDMNGINGLWIMVLYLLDTFLNILCELLISKQSKWNFIVSIFVELAEILICVLLAYRFATMATTLFFWLPVDIISFFNWHKHPDKDEEELTVVRKLSGIGAVLVIAGIVVWTVVVGYFLSQLDIATDLFGGNRSLANLICYIDSCVSAVGIANGLFILFRYREQWIAWYLNSIGEAVINILSGQYVLLVLKIGYLTNTTYGYIRWTKYIRSVQAKKENKM